MISAAVAEWCAVNVYESINGDRAEDVRRGKGKTENPSKCTSRSSSAGECWGTSTSLLARLWCLPHVP